MIKVTSLVKTSKRDGNKLYFEQREYKNPYLFLKEKYLDNKKRLVITNIPQEFWLKDSNATQAFASKIIARKGVLIDSSVSRTGGKRAVSFVEFAKEDVPIFVTDSREKVREIYNKAWGNING